MKPSRCVFREWMFSFEAIDELAKELGIERREACSRLQEALSTSSFFGGIKTLLPDQGQQYLSSYLRYDTDDYSPEFLLYMTHKPPVAPFFWLMRPAICHDGSVGDVPWFFISTSDFYQRVLRPAVSATVIGKCPEGQDSPDLSAKGRTTQAGLKKRGRGRPPNKRAIVKDKIRSFIECKKITLQEILVMNREAKASMFDAHWETVDTAVTELLSENVEK